MAELVFRSVNKITHADWMLYGPIFYDIGPTGPIRFSFQANKFSREYPQAHSNEIYGELSIYHEKFRIIKCGETVLLLLFKYN